MKKVGILTFHRAINYGAVFQCYALRKQLEDMGYDAEVVDYISKDVYSVFKKSVFHFGEDENIIIKILKTIKRTLFFPKLMLKRNNIFNFVKKEIKLSKKHYDKNKLKEHVKKYDYLITGSDQVWNENITTNDSDVYNLSLFSNVKKIGYGVSIGEDNPSQKFIKNLSINIKDYKNIGVREERLKKILDLKNATTVLDPTLLINEKDWEKLFEKKSINVEINDFIFVYMIEINDELIKAVNNFSELTGKKVVNLGYKKVFKDEIKTLDNISPYEFLNYVYNSNFFITDSFHGICFSLIFRKQFISVLHEERSSRQVDLLKMLNLSDRIYSDNMKMEDYISKKNIDYDKVYKIINKKRKESIDFLKNSLEENKN